jgi:small subunit ribosomal protein S16
MLKIKLSRTGKRSQPSYRIIVVNDRSKRDGKYTDMIGTYNPLVNPPSFTLDPEKYEKWIGFGAKPTDTVRLLYKKFYTK